MQDTHVPSRHVGKESYRTLSPLAPFSPSLIRPGSKLLFWRHFVGCPQASHASPGDRVSPPTMARQNRETRLIILHLNSPGRKLGSTRLFRWMSTAEELNGSPPRYFCTLRGALLFELSLHDPSAQGTSCIVQWLSPSNFLSIPIRILLSLAVNSNIFLARSCISHYILHATQHLHEYGIIGIYFLPTSSKHVGVLFN